MKKSIIEDKTFKFAIRVVKLYQYLINEKCEYIMSKQLLRSGTSIGANISNCGFVFFSWLMVLSSFLM